MTQLSPVHHKDNQTTNTLSPKVYIACLASHNNGKLHGNWITVPETVEELKAAIDKFTKSSKWVIHDHEGFDPFDISNNEGPKSIVDKATIVNAFEGEELQAFIAWYPDYSNLKIKEEIIEAFRDAYLGAFDCGEEYAYYHLHERYPFIPEETDGSLCGLSLNDFIDYEGFWDTLTLNGYYERYQKGKTFIFCPL